MKHSTQLCLLYGTERYLYPPCTKVRGIYRNHCLSRRLSVKVKFKGFLTCFRVQYIIFYWFDMSWPFLEHGCITMRRCEAYIHDPNTTLTFDLKIKFTGVLTCFRVCSITFFWFDIDIDLPYLVYASISMRGCVAYIHNPDSTLTFDLKVKFKFCRLRVRPITYVCFDTGTPHLSHGSITMREHVSRSFMILIGVLRTFLTSVWPWPLTSKS